MNTNPLPVSRGLALIAAISVCFVTAAKAQTTINFVELSSGLVQATGSNSVGGTLNAVGANPEVFHLSSPAVLTGYPADATLSRIGFIQSPVDYYLADIYDSPGGPISDQVYVHRLGPGSNFGVIDFFSQPSMFVSLTPTSTVIETGALQDALNYTNDRGELVTINIQSSASAVPDSGSTIVLLSLGVLSLGALRCKLA